MTQGAHLMSTYLNDQLKEDIERDELVARGQLTRDQADEQAEEWTEVSTFGNFSPPPSVL